MDIKLKEQILYSKVITELIKTRKVLAIYLGGSRLLGLDSPESDYDIVVITKDTSLNNYQSMSIPLKDAAAHVIIQSITGPISLIKQPHTLNGYQNCLMLIDIYLCKEEHMIYCTKDFISFKQIISKHKEALTVLALEARLNAIFNTICLPMHIYKKKYHQYLLTHYLLQNFVKTKQLYLDKYQTTTLKNSKTNEVIPADFYESLINRKPHKYYTSRYSYENIYKEVKDYE